MTAVKPEVFTGLFHALTFNHHKDKGQGPLESLDVRDTFIRLCAPFLPRLSLFFTRNSSYLFYLLVYFFFSGAVGASV